MYETKSRDCWFQLFESAYHFFRTNPVPIPKMSIGRYRSLSDTSSFFFFFFNQRRISVLVCGSDNHSSLAQIVLLFTAPCYSSTYLPIADHQSEVLLHIPRKPLTSMLQSEVDRDRKKGFVCDSCLSSCMCGFMCVGCGSISMCGWLWLAVHWLTVAQKLHHFRLDLILQP